MKAFICTLLLISFYTSTLLGQVNWNMVGEVGGDNVTILAAVANGQVLGSMADSKLTYYLDGTLKGNKFEGTAANAEYGITFILTGTYINATLTLDAYIEYGGTNQKAFTALFYELNKDNQSSNLPPQQPHSSHSTAPLEVSNKQIDPLLIGTWREESHYSSGYGDNAFSGSTYNYMSFNSDHTMSDNGSEASMSGSNYSGSSGGQTSGKVIPNLWYYTSSGKIFVYIKTDGSPTVTEIGSYYIENGKMLFTQVNTGKKILYTKM